MIRHWDQHLGGVRMWPYETEDQAVEDALRLARGMTYKNAAAGLNLGGGKTVIIGDPSKDKNEEMFRALGRFIQGLNGRYITAEDVGTTVSDMDLIHEETNYVTGISPTFRIIRKSFTSNSLWCVFRHESCSKRSIWFRLFKRNKSSGTRT